MAGAGYTQAQIDAIAAQLAGAYRRGEQAIVARLLRANLTYWQRVKAQAQLAAIRDVLTEMGEATRDWAQLHIPGLYRAGVAEVDDVMGEELTTFGRLHTETVKLLGENLVTNTNDVLQIVGRRVDDVFRQAQLTALQESTVLGETRRQATRRLLDRIVGDDGTLTVVQYRDGSVHSLSSYGEMVGRTVSQECQTRAVENRMAELGEDLVKISTHPGSCSRCEPYQGQILSLSGTSEEYGSLDDARAAGLFHPNCRHRAMPYIARYAQARERAMESVA